MCLDRSLHKQRVVVEQQRVRSFGLASPSSDHAIFVLCRARELAVMSQQLRGKDAWF